MQPLIRFRPVVVQCKEAHQKLKVTFKRAGTFFLLFAFFWTKYFLLMRLQLPTLYACYVHNYSENGYLVFCETVKWLDLWRNS